MRTLTLALVAGLSLISLSTAQAADLDYGVLRGPEYETVEPVIDWNGVYVGAHGGYTSTSQSYPNRFSGLINDYRKQFGDDPITSTVRSVASELRVFDKRANGSGYGGFIGYNYQFDDTVIGVEFDYTRLDLNAQSKYGIFTTVFDNNNTLIEINGIAKTQIVDYGTARVRAGYAIGSFMPFVTGGLAIGRAEIGQQIVVTSTSNAAYNRVISDRNIDANTSNAVRGEYVKTKVVGGVALGAGVEWALTQNIILRGEYQYVLFNDFDGHKVNMNTVRAGAALKF